MRIIKAVVILMSILIVVGFGVLIWRMYNISSKPRQMPVAAAPERMTERMAAQTGAAANRPAPGRGFGAVSLGLPAGCEIAGASADAGRLVVHTSCGEIRVLDLATGAPLGSVTR